MQMASFMTDPIFGHQHMRKIFSDDALCTAMIKVEVELAKVQWALGVIPEGAGQAIADGLADIAVPHAELRAGVANAGVPVPALLGILRAKLRPAEADWLHFGATSQDIVDTAYNLCFDRALDEISQLLDSLINRLEGISKAHSKTLMLARTRGQIATPITFGLRAAHWAQPLIALEAEIADIRRAALRVQLGGASGSRSVWGDKGTDIATALAQALGLHDSGPWHTDRSGLRRLAQWLTRITTATAKIGRDFAISARSEIGELHQSSGGGSSAMPHKSNPVLAEALQSLAPVAAAADAALAAGAVHAEERDGAFWPVEWQMMPLLSETAAAGLDRAGDLLAGMRVDAEKMRRWVDATPEAYAEALVMTLAQHIGRNAAIQAVHDAMQSGRPLDALQDKFPEIDLRAAMADAAFTGPAAKTAAQIFAGRRGDGQIVLKT